MAKKIIDPVQSCLARCATHASADETRYNLTFVKVEPARLWATDGHRVLILRNHLEIAPGFYSGGTRLADETGTWLPDMAPAGLGDYPMQMPDVDQIIPQTNKPAIDLDGVLVDELTLMWNAMKASTHVATTFREGRVRVQLTVTTGSGKNVKEKKVAWNMAGPEMKQLGKPFGVNLYYLLDALDGVGYQGGTITLYQEDPLSPIRVDGPFGFALIMPFRL